MSVSALSEQLVKAGHQVAVLTTTANGHQELNVAPNAEVMVDGVAVTYFERLTKDHSHYSPKLLLSLKKQINGFDVVHIHAWWNLVSVLSCFIALKKGARVVVSPRGTLSNYSFTHKGSFIKRAFHKFVGKKLLNRCIIHVTSAAEQCELEGLITPTKFYNIANFIELPEQKDAPISAESGTIRLLFLSRIDEKKGLDVLFNALAMVNIPWRLSIAGDGDPKYISELKSLAEEKQIGQHIKWLGFRQADKFDAYAAHDLFVLPSHNENFGNVVIESLSMGTPVLVSKNVGLADFVAGHNAGWVFDLTPSALKNTIERAAAEKEKIMLINKTGRQLIDANFGSAILINKYINMYKQITGNE